MKKIFKFILLLITLILIKLLFTFSMNKLIIYNYNRDNNCSILIKTLYIFNFNQPYIAYYNNGNILYQKGDYNESLKKYNQALEKHPPQSKVCNIRINISLTKIKLINSNDVQEALKILEEARTNLYENNCAHQNDDNGYSKTAEKLEEEIKELENEFKNSNTTSSNNNSNEESNQNKEEFNNVEEELKQNNKEAQAKREETLSNYEEYSSYYESFTQKNW